MTAAPASAVRVLSVRVPIVLVCSSSGMGGMEAHVIQLARGLVARGVPVAAICSRRDDLAELRDGLASSGVTVHELPERDHSALGAIRRCRLLASTLAGYRGGVVHLHSGGFGGGELLQLAAALAGVRAVVRTEHVPPVPPFSAKSRLLVRARDRFLSKVVYVSAQNRDEHVRVLGRDPRRAIVVHNGVDIAALTPAIDRSGVHAEFGFPADAPIVGTVARLVERRKAIDDFITMAAIVRKAAPDARYLVVGDGPLRPELEAQSRQRGLEDVLVFAGERKDTPRLMSAMSAFVLPSLYEGCQYALLEAMAIGRPVVSTRAGVAPAIVRDRVSGLLVPFRDPAAVAAAVLAVLGDPSFAAALGRAAREAVVRGFSVDAMVDELLATYAQAAGGS